MSEERPQSATVIKIPKTEKDESNGDSLHNGHKLRYKSFRKKFRKMKVHFEEKMEEANSLFMQEHKAWEIAIRLQEQNDQLLDILLDINDCAKIPPHFRYNLKSPLQTPATSPSSRARSTVNGHVPKGHLSLSQLEKGATHTIAAGPEEDSNFLPPDLITLPELALPGYYSPTREAQHLSAIDVSLAKIPSTEHLPADVEAIQPLLRSREKTVPTSQDFATQCPVSVYNWLRKHQPQVFDTKDKDSEKGDVPVRGGARARKDKDKTGLTKKEPIDPLDEELGFISDGGLGSSSKGKRKRDDEAYRPKGGHSRQVKRKRDKEEGDLASKATKKPRKSAAFIEDEG